MEDAVCPFSPLDMLLASWIPNGSGRQASSKYLLEVNSGPQSRSAETNKSRPGSYTHRAYSPVGAVHIIQRMTQIELNAQMQSG